MSVRSKENIGDWLNHGPMWDSKLLPWKINWKLEHILSAPAFSIDLSENWLPVPPKFHCLWPSSGMTSPWLLAVCAWQTGLHLLGNGTEEPLTCLDAAVWEEIYGGWREHLNLKPWLFMSHILAFPADFPFNRCWEINYLAIWPLSVLDRALPKVNRVILGTRSHPFGWYTFFVHPHLRYRRCKETWGISGWCVYFVPLWGYKE